MTHNAIWMLLWIIVCSAFEDLVFIEEPQNATVKLNDEMILRCSFRFLNGICIWKKNGNVLKPTSDNLSYLISSTATSNNVTNCTIKMRNIRKTDFGYYQCTTLLTSTSHMPSNSRRAWISEFVDEDVGNVTARPNDSVILKCTFNQSNGTCIWKRNGKVLKIGDRISWVSRDSSRNAMTHCSIKVKEVQHTDFGMYECIIFKTSSGENENDTDNQAIYIRCPPHCDSDANHDSVIYGGIGGSGGLLLVLLLICGYCYCSRRCSRNGSSVLVEFPTCFKPRNNRRGSLEVDNKSSFYDHCSSPHNTYENCDVHGYLLPNSSINSDQEISQWVIEEYTPRGELKNSSDNHHYYKIKVSSQNSENCHLYDELAMSNR